MGLLNSLLGSDKPPKCRRDDLDVDCAYRKVGEEEFSPSHPEGRGSSTTYHIYKCKYCGSTRRENPFNEPNDSQDDPHDIGGVL
ncbi:hypothetical protein [Halorubrum kocurii]|uniref:hypothetical protein n=1 Tax=Halorubrum kocurii TaxID=478441 RepID=UPI0012685CCE|nr:hypothetical protein [Halorubrum kocurii]